MNQEEFESMLSLREYIKYKGLEDDYARWLVSFNLIKKALRGE